MENKEYGGYIPFVYGNRNYYSNIEKDKIISLNSARNAIALAVEDGKFSCVWVPVYTCESVHDTLKKNGINYKLYGINEEFEPIIDSIGDNDCIIITNYFGTKNDSFYFRMCNKFRNIIFDNTQAFFSKPILEKNIYNVYSPRKFVGVSDGAYLITDEFKRIYHFDKDYSANRAAYLFKAVESGTNHAYSLFLASEDEISKSDVKEMSELTSVLLSNIDYDTIEKRRKTNYKTAHDLFDDFNEINVKDYDINVSPMVYPLLLSISNVRKKLIENRIYIPQWWKWVLNNPKSNQFERMLSMYLLPIPIDQRYNEDDIIYISKVIRSCL